MSEVPLYGVFTHGLFTKSRRIPVCGVLKRGSDGGEVKVNYLWAFAPTVADPNVKE